MVEVVALILGSILVLVVVRSINRRKARHDYERCGTCDDCQADYIAQKMRLFQEDLRLKEKREFETRVKKEIEELRAKNGLDVPTEKSWEEKALDWKRMYEREVERNLRMR